MTLLSGGSGRRGAEQGVHQGLVVCEKGEFTTLQEETEMADGGVGCCEFSVKGGVFGFGKGKLLGEEGKGLPGAMETLLKDSTHMRVSQKEDGGTQTSQTE